MVRVEGVRSEGPYERVVDAEDAARQLPALLERVEAGEDFLIEDGSGRRGLLVNAEHMEELGELLSLARNTYGKLAGEQPVPHEEFARQMGQEPGDADAVRKSPDGGS